MQVGITHRGNMAMKELETTLTQKGQVTIPVAIRSRLGLKPKDKVRFEVDGDEVKIKLAPSKLLAGYGAVAPTKRPEDWHAVREAVEQAIAEEVAREG